MPYLVQRRVDGSVANKWKISQHPLVVGRGQEADAKVDDPEMSRKHFSVTPQGAGYQLRDLQSKNGTRVNDAPVTERALNPKDRIAAGESSFTFDAEEPVADMPTLTNMHKPKVLK